MKTFTEWAKSLLNEEEDSLSSSDLRFNLDKTVKSSGKLNLRNDFPALYKEIGRLSPEAKSDLQKILKILMDKSVSWGNSLGRKLR